MPLTKDQILAAAKRDITTVHVPALGGDVCVRPLSGAEASEVYATCTDRRSITEAIVARSLCDADGNRLFETSETAALFDKPYNALTPLMEAAMRINLVGVEAQDDAKKG
jgi:hypothetical protein